MRVFTPKSDCEINDSNDRSTAIYDYPKCNICHALILFEGAVYDFTLCGPEIYRKECEETKTQDEEPIPCLLVLMACKC